MISGKYLIATIGNTLIRGVMEWRARETAEKLDGQTGAHLGFSANEPGTQTLNVDLTLVQDIATGEYSKVAAGTTITDLRLYRADPSVVTGQSPAFQVPVFNVFESDNGAAVRDKFTVKCSGENLGPYTKNDPGG